MRLLSSLLIALALFFSPLAMASQNGMAAAHGGAATGTAGMAGHCAGADEQNPDTGSKMRMDCMSACAAVPALPPAVAALPVPQKPVVAARVPARLNGIPQENATPPPRFS